MKIVHEWLSACSGCETVLLDYAPFFEQMIHDMEIIYMPLLMDRKTSPPSQDPGQADTPIYPEADIAIVSGALRSEQDLARLLAIKKSSNRLIALGTCATHGGIPALSNSFTADQLIGSVFNSGFPATPGDQTDGADGAVPRLPQLLDRVYAVDEKSTPDLLLPGCPPNPAAVMEAISALARGEHPRLPERSVCDTCPTVRTGKGEVKGARRFLENIPFHAESPIHEMRCLLEQGLVCMGPVTAAGCAREGAPQCIMARVPCRGCFGPVRSDGNQMLDMMNALASNGMDWRSIVDRRSLLHFSGAHGLLRPPRARNR
jgi:F420-non-reducing hydrogenase small subunit